MSVGSDLAVMVTAGSNMAFMNAILYDQVETSDNTKSRMVNASSRHGAFLLISQCAGGVWRYGKG